MCAEEEEYLKCCHLQRYVIWVALYSRPVKLSTQIVFSILHRGNPSGRLKSAHLCLNNSIKQRGYIMSLGDRDNMGASISVDGRRNQNSHSLLTILMSRFNILLGTERLKMVENIQLSNRWL